ncbi:MAG: YfhO family protein [Bacteroidales bacterium]|jgi:hypothetical protein|nr:YfhO family protein [Bacteroidales bacterium]
MEMLKKIAPHAIAIVAFAVVSLVYFSPLLEGKRIKQYDIEQYGGAAREIADFRDETGEEPLWTNSMFGGMPANQISVQYHNNWTVYLAVIFDFRLPMPASFLFAAFLGFYIALLCFRVNPWLSIIGAFAYGLSAYFLIIIGAGHNTKMRALTFLPPIIGGVHLAFREKKIRLGAIITCLTLALQIRVNHFQITYYTGFIVLIYMIFEITGAIRKRQYLPFIKASGALLLAVALAAGLNITSLLLTAEYTPYSTRGASELSNTDGDKTKGLDKSYILNNYSYGIAETMNLFIPNFVGGASAGPANRNTPFYKALEEKNIPKQEIAKYTKYVPLYWGGQDGGTSGPVYIGAVMVFLFVLGLFVVKGSIKWWLLSATVVSVVLAWGKHCMLISDFFIDFFPGYNKFRTVSMILVIAEFTVPLLGILAVKELLEGRISAETKKHAIKKSLYITGGIALFFAVFPGLLFNFTSPADNSIAAENPDWLMTALYDTREYILRMDALRSLFFTTAAAAVLWLGIAGKLKTASGGLLLAALIIIDLWTVDKRYLNNDKFVAAKEVVRPKPSVADEYILNDKNLDYRVLNLSNPFNDALTSYFHKSIGGYHGAKMKRYQELIEHRLSEEISTVITNIQSVKTMQDFSNLLSKCPGLNMLNTRYIIINPGHPALNNPAALGNAWLVREIRRVNNADEEIAALANFDPAREAIIDKRFEPLLKDFSITADSAAQIRLTAYQPNRLTYEYSAAAPQLAVFSEIHYDRGWQAFIDGQPAPHFRADYVLRAMTLPEGTHQIEFRFESHTYLKGEKISLASSILLVLLLLGSVADYFVKRKKQA